MKALDAVRTLALQAGKPARSGNLTLVPLSGPFPGPAYLTLAEAQAGGLALLSEVSPQGRLSAITIRNLARLPVLVVEGEVLLGLKQHRVLNTTVLVPAGGEVEASVSCVEVGRWGNSSGSAAGRSEVNLSPRVRAVKNRSVGACLRESGGFWSDQGAVWEELDRVLTAHGVTAPTRSFAQLSAARSSDLEALVGGMRPGRGQCGVAAAVGGRLVCLDVFDRPETLALLWRRLVLSYAVDALLEAGGWRTASTALTAAWIACLLEGSAATRPAIGLGETVQLSGPQGTASALVVEGAVIHLAAFATPRSAPPVPPGAGRRR